MTDDETIAEAYARLEALAVDDPGLAHSMRFRKMSNRYPHVVAEAYELDLARAAADSDEQVAVTVAEWERAHGLEVRDWYTIGTAEGRDR